MNPSRPEADIGGRYIAIGEILGWWVVFGAMFLIFMLVVLLVVLGS